MTSSLERVLAGWREQAAALMSDAVKEARAKARGELAEGLNHAARRLRSADSIDEIGVGLVEEAAPFCGLAALLEVVSPAVRGVSLRGASSPETFGELTAPLFEAPALASVVESADTVVAIASANELSAELAGRLRLPPQEKLYLFPVEAAGEVAGIFCAAPADAALDVAALELLCALASAAWSGLAPPSPAAAPVPNRLVTIEGVAPRRPAAAEWNSLSREDQDLHLRAQRFARVRVAEMRLHKSEAVRTGRLMRDVYTALRSDIDLAREVFQRDFLKASSTMIDYLHAELVSTLAHDDPSLLGRAYPGPCA